MNESGRGFKGGEAAEVVVNGDWTDTEEGRVRTLNKIGRAHV